MTTPSLSRLLRVDPDGFDLPSIDARGMPGLPDRKEVRKDPKGWSRAEFAEVSAELARRQEQLYAQGKTNGDRRRLLLVLQGMDCSGKGGATKHVAGAMNPAGVRAVSFGKPTPEEHRHHFLWRIKNALPGPGRVGVFDRSHYEDVLVARVNDLVPRRTWQARYDQINRFERELVDSGCAVLKVMLHISPEEQLERLAARLADPAKHWKYNPGDLDDRGRWPAYQQAYADALIRCSTPYAPWHVVPADRKWYRNWAVAHLLVEAFGAMGLEYPPGDFDVAAESERLSALK